MAIQVKKIIFVSFLTILAIVSFLAFLSAPSVSAVEVPYLVATPKEGFSIKDSMYYLPPGTEGKFQVRYCGKPTEDSLKVELYIDTSLKSAGDVTNIQTSIYYGDGKCELSDKKYHGDPPTNLSWVPDESSRGKVVSFKIKDEKGRVSSSAGQITITDPPEGSTTGGGSWDLSNVNRDTFTNMINITDIFSGNRFDLSNQVDFPTPEGLVQKAADVLLILAGILAVIAFIWSGYQFIISSGDSAKVEKAKKAMISAFIGVVLIIFAYSIIRAVDIFSSPPLSSSIPEAKFE